MDMHEDPGPPRTSYSDLHGPRRWLVHAMLDQVVEALRGSEGFEGMPRDVIWEYAVVLLDSGHLRLSKDGRGSVGWAVWKEGRYSPM